MTNASAMFLVLVVFAALALGAFVVILWGGGSQHAHRRGHAAVNHNHPRAA